ncbi:Prefoldin beta-like protein [Ascobolus immersus RN42]|uniref:Prefoldin beta-like protein n=1 Tax=Ascobolus immersus RN42 TaxID=1160509 RepID=A0A3N4HUB7_ASCIM|nr:Prefoldin beta-like protein [Ascobolus immersus RN42]
MATINPEAQRLQRLTEEYQDLQKDLQESVETRQKLESQLHESGNVQAEFDALEDDAAIYKLVGPVLMKQEKEEARLNVKKRLEYITGDMKRVEDKIKDIQEKSEAKKMEIIELQTQLQNGQNADPGVQ